MKLIIFFVLAGSFSFAWYFARQIKKQLDLLNQIDYLKYHGLPCFSCEKEVLRDLRTYILALCVCLFFAAYSFYALNN